MVMGVSVFVLFLVRAVVFMWRPITCAYRWRRKDNPHAHAVRLSLPAPSAARRVNNDVFFVLAYLLPEVVPALSTLISMHMAGVFERSDAVGSAAVLVLPVDTHGGANDAMYIAYDDPEDGGLDGDDGDVAFVAFD